MNRNTIPIVLMALCILIGLPFAANSTTVYTVPTTTVTQNQAIAYSCFNGVLSIFICPINIVPYFLEIVCFLAFGIGYITTKRLSNGFLAMLLISTLYLVIAYKLGATQLGIQLLLAATISAIGLVLAFMYESNHPRPKK